LPTRFHYASLRLVYSRLLRGYTLEQWIDQYIEGRNGVSKETELKSGITNLRSSREWELVEQFPVTVVAYWMNHYTRIAEKHYPQATDDYYHRAASCEVSNGEQRLASKTSIVWSQVGATSHVLARQRP